MGTTVLPRCFQCSKQEATFKPSPDRHDSPRRDEMSRRGQSWTNRQPSLFLPFLRRYPSAPIKLSATNHRNSATILAAVIENICCPSSEHFQTIPEAALVDTVYTDTYGINMPRLTKKKKCAILLSILIFGLHNSVSVRVSLRRYVKEARPFLPHGNQLVLLFFFPEICHLARDRPHDLLRHMTRPIYMLLSHWPNYLETFCRVVRLSAPIRWVPTSTDGVRLRSNMLSLHNGLRADGKRLSRSRGSVRTAPTTPDETSRCVAS